MWGWAYWPHIPKHEIANMKDRFVKTITIAVPLVVQGKGMTLAKSFSGAGYTIDDSDFDAMRVVNRRWIEVREIVGIDRPLPPGPINSATELVKWINHNWGGVTASEYGFALKED